MSYYLCEGRGRPGHYFKHAEDVCGAGGLTQKLAEGWGRLEGRCGREQTRLEGWGGFGNASVDTAEYGEIESESCELDVNSLKSANRDGGMEGWSFGRWLEV